MQELFNGYEAAIQAAMLSGVKCVVSDKPADSVNSFAAFNHIDAAIGFTLNNKRSFVINQSLEKALSLRLPIAGISPIDALCASVGYCSGGLTILPESSQEVFDSIIISYAVCENRKVLLPASIVIDNLAINTREVLELPTEKIVENFLGQLNLDKKHLQLFGDEFGNGTRWTPIGLGSKAQIQKAMENSKKIIDDVHNRWRKKFRRTYGFFEKYMLDDADYAFVVYGSNSINTKIAVKALRDSGEKVGLLRLRVFRPWPDVSDALKNVKKVAVIDSKSVFGSWGMAYPDIKLSYSGFASNFIGDIINVNDFIEIFKRLKTSEKPERVWML